MEAWCSASLLPRVSECRSNFSGNAHNISGVLQPREGVFLYISVWLFRAREFCAFLVFFISFFGEGGWGGTGVYMLRNSWFWMSILFSIELNTLSIDISGREPWTMPLEEPLKALIMSTSQSSEALWLCVCAYNFQTLQAVLNHNLTIKCKALSYLLSCFWEHVCLCYGGIQSFGRALGKH